MRFDTKLLHGQATKSHLSGATIPPISQVSAFAYDTAEELEKVFNNRAPGFAYTRISNPIIDSFERRVNELEGGKGAVACASGMSAITQALLNILSEGDEIIAGSGLFGGTIDLFKDFEKFGIKTRFVKHITIEEIEPLINENTKVVYGEVIGNPGLDVMDIKAVADFVHSKNIPLIVDSTTATPYLIRPFEFGADIIVHSSSKYINGSGNSISGVIVDSGNFKWDGIRYKGFEEYKKYGSLAYIAKLRNGIWRNMGGCLAPMNAFLNIIGMETLGLRMERICDNAKSLAEAINQTGIVTANYPTIEGSPYQDLVKKQFNGKGGGILTIRAGSKERAYRFMNTLKYALKATNIGDSKTLVIHPASTIYTHNTKEQMQNAGVWEDTIRVSIGIEDTQDLIEDFIAAIKSL
ncbi:MAG: O-acetylhomoserine aminocarboxypropyltransferase/cysteine synthase [Cellulosilyticum sp.]|nr:O-acetylhomoserine aminocarboxypropyltransferase/cysteine synthase [Cellulosilyticum sp.]